MAKIIQRPTGTRDFYPADMARRRYIEETWRAVGTRFGFEEVDGPTFEHLELYTIKSGEGIVSELFSFRRTGGKTDFGLRPEFTPTLARLYATMAGGDMPAATKWFSVGPFFRAERPQRGRLREFLQWNVDCIGLEGVDGDAECIACCVGALEAFGVPRSDITIKISDRNIVTDALKHQGVAEADLEKAMMLLDRVEKLPPEEFEKQASAIGLDRSVLMSELASLQDAANGFIRALEQGSGDEDPTDDPRLTRSFELVRALDDAGIAKWCAFDLSVVRGIAYYTGIVFEALVDGERAVAGGGRYDNLIELFGGPPTPAIGFAMGDVVLSLVLEDRGLLPSDEDVADRLSLRPDVFVVPTGNNGVERVVRPLIAQLRREGLHVRRTYRETRKVGKLLKEADASRARYALIIESPTSVSIKNLATQEQREDVEIAELSRSDFA